MREKKEERRRYVKESFGELPVRLRQAVLHHLQEKTAARRGDRTFALEIEDVSFAFAVRETQGAPLRDAADTLDDAVEKATGPLHHR